MFFDAGWVCKASQISDYSCIVAVIVVFVAHVVVVVIVGFVVRFFEATCCGRSFWFRLVVKSHVLRRPISEFLVVSDMVAGGSTASHGDEVRVPRGNLEDPRGRLVVLKYARSMLVVSTI